MNATHIKNSIAILEARRAILGGGEVDIAIKVLRQVLGSQVDLPTPDSAPKQLTVCYATLHGWENFSDTLSPKESNYIFDRLWQRMDADIAVHHGRSVTHIGYSFVALFGADGAVQDDVGNAVRASLEIKQSLQNFLMEWSDAQAERTAMPNLQFSIALHTGSVFSRQSNEGDEEELLGNAVAVAQFLNYHADAGQILITQSLYQQVRGVFYTQQQSPVFGGMDDTRPTNVYEIKGAKPYAVRVISHSVEGVETSMVGRSAELAKMQSAFEAVTANQRGKFIVLRGTSGIGKSRLLYEFDDWLEKQPRRIHFLQGRSSVQTSQLPFWVWRDIFAFYAEIFASDSTALTEKKLSQAINGMVGSNTDETALYIGHLLGLTTLPAAIISDEASSILEKAEAAITRFFEALVADGTPVVLILEDIHWADSASMQILQRIWLALKDSPIFIVCSMQAKLFQPSNSWLMDDSQVENVTLPALSDAASAKLIEQILQKIPTLSPKLRENLIENAHGHPLLIEELIQLLIDQDVILPTPTRWHVDNDALVAMGDLPSTLEAVLQARLAKIPTLEREMLQRASAIGRAFWNVALSQISDATTHQMGLEIIDVVLDNLQERGLILQREASPFAKTKEYIFKHSFLRDIVYQSLPSHRLSAYHTQIAAWLIEHNGEQVDAYAALIAAHYRAANIPVTAAEWFCRAGEQSRRVFAWSVSVDHFRIAMNLMENNWRQSDETRQLWRKILQGLAAVLGQRLSGVTPSENETNLFERATNFAQATDDDDLTRLLLERWLDFEKSQTNSTHIDMISTWLHQLSP